MGLFHYHKIWCIRTIPPINHDHNIEDYSYLSLLLSTNSASNDLSAAMWGKIKRNARWKNMIWRNDTHTYPPKHPPPTMQSFWLGLYGEHDYGIGIGNGGRHKVRHEVPSIVWGGGELSKIYKYLLFYFLFFNLNTKYCKIKCYFNGGY